MFSQRVLRSSGRFMFWLRYGKATFSRVRRVSIQRDFDSCSESPVISPVRRLFGDRCQSTVRTSPSRCLDSMFAGISIPGSPATSGGPRNARHRSPSTAELLKLNYEISMTIWRDNYVINMPFPFISQHACYAGLVCLLRGPLHGIWPNDRSANKRYAF